MVHRVLHIKPDELFLNYTHEKRIGLFNKYCHDVCL